MHTYYIFQGILKIFSNTYALPLSLANCKQLRKCNCLYQSLLLAMFFLSIDVKIQSFYSRFDHIITQPLFRDIIAVYHIEIAC